MKILNYARPETREEAYELMQHGGTLIGGGAWLKLQPKTIDQAIDLMDLGLNKIENREDGLWIGSMVTLRQLETNSLLQSYMGGFIADCAGLIMGVMVRNIATVGGTVASGFGFSDLIPCLLAADAELEWHKQGLISLEAYLKDGLKDKDLLIGIKLKEQSGKGAYQMMRKTSIDFPVVNAAVAVADGKCRVAIGSRPGKAALAGKAMEVINGDGSAEDAAKAISEDVSFGSNSRGSAEYREAVAVTLVERCLKEVQA